MKSGHFTVGPRMQESFKLVNNFWVEGWPVTPHGKSKVRHFFGLAALMTQFCFAWRNGQVRFHRSKFNVLNVLFSGNGDCEENHHYNYFRVFHAGPQSNSDFKSARASCLQVCHTRVTGERTRSWGDCRKLAGLLPSF